jgi:hypothetical protein
MRQEATYRAVTNEAQYPHIVELVVADDELDVKLSLQVINFHSLRKIQARHGRRVVREGQIYFRWCFSDLETAHALKEQFGGEVVLRLGLSGARPLSTSMG